jgi:hypothetical protein
MTASKQLASAYACFDEGRLEETLSLLRTVPAGCTVTESMFLAATALVAEQNGDRAMAEHYFEQVFAIGVPLPALLRETARYFKRNCRFERSYQSYALLQDVLPGAMDEFLEGLPPEAFRYLPHIVPRLLEGERPRFYTFRPAKEALLKHYGIAGGALILSQLTDRRNGDSAVRRLQLTSLQAFAKDYGLTYEEMSSRKQVVLPPAHVFGQMKASNGMPATPRAFFFSILADVVVSSTSNILLAGGRALLDFQSDELERVPLNLDVDPIVLSADDDSVTVLNGYAPAPRPRVDEAFSLVGVHSGVFGHWMIEFLPKLWACLQRSSFESVPILIDEQMPIQHREALEIFAGPHHPIIILKPRESVHIGLLWCCSMPVYLPLGRQPGAQYVPGLKALDTKAFAALLQKQGGAVDSVAGPIQEPKRRLYLKRKSTQKRKLVNGEEVERWFLEHGFDSVDFSDVPFRDQVRLMRDAEFVVGPDGSAFYMVLFARPGTRIGLLTHKYFDDFEWYPQLCRELHHYHCVLTGELVREDPMYRQFSDYKIDLRKLPLFFDQLASSGMAFTTRKRI